jgi:tetratricopeptide (TPR) repeat protein
MTQLQAAIAALGAGRAGEAERSLRRLLRQEPDNAVALQCLGIALHAQGNHTQALGFLDRSLRADPASTQAHNNRATVLNALGRPAEALESLDRAIALNANDPELHYNRGNTLLALLRDTDALAAFERAIALRPAFREAWQNKGIILTRLGRAAEALEAYDRLLSLFGHAPDQATVSEARVNRAWALDQLGRRDAALDDCERAMADDPEYALAHFNAAPILLAKGDYARGWREYEWRWRNEKFRHHARQFRQALWLGDADIAGKTILLHAEQGYGDTVQFCRYAPMVQALGARVLLEVPPPLLPLLRTLRGYDELLARGTALPEFDVHTPLMSLPLALGTRLDSVPDPSPYLSADADRVGKWQSILGPRLRPRVGLAWSGNPTLAADALRSVKLDALAPLLLDGIEFVSVQRDVRPADEDAAARLGVRLTGGAIEDFADTAALISLLDLVISVDSAPAHVAGALAKPVWLLLYFAPEWRWLMDRDDSPWYRSARLFRQARPHDWGELAVRVGDALREQLGGGVRKDSSFF